MELCNNNASGTVCDDFWGAPDAMVVCRQLGFSPNGMHCRHIYYVGKMIVHFKLCSMPHSSNFLILLQVPLLGLELSMDKELDPSIWTM